MHWRLKMIGWVPLLVFLPTCSLNSFRPNVTVQITLPNLQTHPNRRVGRGPSFPKCVAYSLSSPSTADQLSKAQLQQISPSCVLLPGIVSRSVTVAVATTAGVQITAPIGSYSITAVGIDTAADCGDVATIFTNSLPGMYRLSPSIDFNTAQGTVEITSTYQSSTAVNLVDPCLPTGWVKTISAGGASSCADVRGAAKCWGFNGNGQLGNNSSAFSTIPIQVQGFTSGVSAVSISDFHSCGIINGGVQCWGLNNDGQLGNNLLISSQIPVQVQGLLAGATSVNASPSQSCAAVSGAAYCWGKNTNGELGNNSTTPSQIPVLVQGLASGVTSVTGGTGHTCAIVNGGAQCWGYNGFGQLGNNSPATPFLVPVQVEGLTSGVTALDAGAGHTCAVVNGAAYCWGYNPYGQLGNNSTAAALIPVLVQGLTSGVTAISAGGNHTCAVVNGAALCWGYNFSGQLGINSNTDSLIPVQVQGLAAGVTAISAGTSHTCAVVNGAAQCWGINSWGQLGNNTQENTLVPVVVSGIGP